MSKCQISFSNRIWTVGSVNSRTNFRGSSRLLAAGPSRGRCRWRGIRSVAPTYIADAFLIAAKHLDASPDLLLVKAVIARDRKATAHFIALHAEDVHKYIYRRLAPRVNAVEDLVQEVFLASWKGLATFTGHAPLRNWVLGIARNKVEDYYRGVCRAQLFSLDDESNDELVPSYLSDVADILDAAHRAKEAANVLSTMRYDYSILLRWRYWDERSVSDIALSCNKTEKAVERSLARARRHFKQAWPAKGDA